MLKKHFAPAESVDGLGEWEEDLVGESPFLFRPTQGGDKAGRLGLHADAQVKMTCNDNRDDNDDDNNIDDNDDDNNIDNNDGEDENANYNNIDEYEGDWWWQW